MTYVDKFTGRPIEYDKNSVFVIYLKGSYRKKRPIKYFTCERIEEAFKTFYDLDIATNQRKYLKLHHKDHMSEQDGETIYSMKGYLPQTMTPKIKMGNGMISYRKIATINMIHTPITLAKKIHAVDFDSFPLINEKWTKTKLAYCLFAYFFDLPIEERNKLLARAHKLYVSEKVESGGNETDALIFKEIIALKKGE